MDSLPVGELLCFMCFLVLSSVSSLSYLSGKQLLINRGVPIIGSADISVTDIGILVILVICIILYGKPIFVHAHHHYSFNADANRHVLGFSRLLLNVFTEIEALPSLSSSNETVTISSVTSADTVTSADKTTSAGLTTSADEIPLSRPVAPKPRFKPVWRSPV